MADVVVKYITIIKGSDRQFSVRVVSKESQDPFNFNGVTEIKAIFRSDQYFDPNRYPGFYCNPDPHCTPDPHCGPRPPFPFPPGHRIPPVEISFTGGQIVPDPYSQGKLMLFLKDTETVLLEPGDEQSFEMLITYGSLVTIVQFLHSIRVVERLFPGVT